jgi:hypothetical protein
VRLVWLAVIASASGCDLVGREIVDEFEEDARDDTIKVTFSEPWVFVGGFGTAVAADGCTPADFHECETSSVTITQISASGSLQNASFIGTSIRFSATQTPGGGTLSVSGTIGTSAGAGGGSISVVGPDTVVIEPSCGRSTAGAPFLAATGGEARIHWDFYVGGQPAFGDTGQVHAQAAGFELIERIGTAARFTTPGQPGLVSVTSTVGSSTFDYLLYDPATAVLAPLTVADEMQEWGDRFTVDSVAMVDGREACVDPVKILRSETPTVCLLEEDTSAVVERDTASAKIPVIAMTSGTCTISATLGATAQVVSLQFDVQPVPIAERGWDATCEVEPGTTCGVTCARLNCWKPTGCQRLSGGEFSCLYGPDPEDTDPECEGKKGTLVASEDEHLCWPSI